MFILNNYQKLTAFIFIFLVTAPNLHSGVISDLVKEGQNIREVEFLTEALPSRLATTEMQEQLQQEYPNLINRIGYEQLKKLIKFILQLSSSNSGTFLNAFFFK